MNTLIKHFLGFVGYNAFITFLKIFSFVPKVGNDAETINAIVRGRKSVSRFGDGEFLWILMEREDGQFEHNSAKLSADLNRVLHLQRENLLICIPNVYHGFKNYKPSARLFWEKILLRRGLRIQHLLEPRQYFTSQFTRPYIDYKRDSEPFSSKFHAVKDIWNNRNVLIVEGSLTRFGVGSDLLSNASSVRRVICPSKDAYESYSSIYNTVLKVSDGCQDVLVLAALGPTATILAADLSERGIQCVDIGHLDLEYEWYLHNVDDRTPIPGRDVNEISEEIIPELPASTKKKYSDEIVAVAGGL